MNLECLKLPKGPNKKLYKYFSEDKFDREKRDIEEGKIFCSRMCELNDIFDGKFYLNNDNLENVPNIENYLIDYVVEMLKSYNYIKYAEKLLLVRDSFNVCKNLKEVLTKAEDYIDNDLNVYSLYLEYENKNFNKDSANLCSRSFSEVNNSLLMWAYYASSHKGFCIEYDLTTQQAKEDYFVNNIQKVNYSDNFPINYINGLAFFTKSQEWSHEQEWRLIIDTKTKYYKKGFKIDFPYASAIYLGVNFDNDKIAIMKQFANKNNLKIFQMKIVDNRYEICPVSI